MQTYGTREEAGAFVLTSIRSGPLMSMIILGASGAAHFEPQVFVGAVLPFLVGFALGNLDPKLRAFFAPGGQLMISFFAFALGNTIDLHTLLSPLAGLGVVLALSVIVLTGAPLIIADKLIGRGTGTAGMPRPQPPERRRPTRLRSRPSLHNLRLRCSRRQCSSRFASWSHRLSCRS